MHLHFWLRRHPLLQSSARSVASACTFDYLRPSWLLVIFKLGKDLTRMDFMVTVRKQEKNNVAMLTFKHKQRHRHERIEVGLGGAAQIFSMRLETFPAQWNYYILKSHLPILAGLGPFCWPTMEESSPSFALSIPFSKWNTQVWAAGAGEY